MLSVSKLFLSAAMFGLATGTVSAVAAESSTENPPLRVCGDPGNMPLSNKQGEGFQNKVAEILAKGMGTTLEYYWYPYYGRGLARNTINANNCDVLMDVPSDYEMALTTKPYYKTTFVLTYRHDRHHTVTSLDDPILKKWKIGVLQSSPARAVLWEHGVMLNTQIHYVFYDLSTNPQDRPGEPGRQVAAGRLFEELLGAVGEDVVSVRHADRNARMAATVSSGALRFGQWPVAARWTSRLSAR